MHGNMNLCTRKVKKLQKKIRYIKFILSIQYIPLAPLDHYLMFADN